MKNLTLRIDEKVLAAARKEAALQGTTVAKLVRRFIADFASKAGGGVLTVSESEAEEARQKLLELSDRSVWGLGGWKWNREDLYEDRFSRFERDNLRGARSGRGFAEEAPGENADGGD